MTNNTKIMLLNLPEDLNTVLKVYRLEHKLQNMQAAIIVILQEKFKDKLKLLNLEEPLEQKDL